MSEPSAVTHARLALLRDDIYGRLGETLRRAEAARAFLELADDAGALYALNTLLATVRAIAESGHELAALRKEGAR